MKNLPVKIISCAESDPSPEVIAKLLRGQTSPNTIDTVNWPSFPYRPDVNFRIGHIRKEIWLSFHVREKNPRGTVTQTNGPVYQDSCVEFFISPRSDGRYYNIELNCLGTVLAGYGSGRDDLELLDTSVVSMIRTFSSPGTEPMPDGSGDYSWQLVVTIPADFFIHDRIESFGGMRSRGNFHSCSDLAEQKRYLTWSPVLTQKPDFHRYEFFGGIFFD